MIDGLPTTEPYPLDIHKLSKGEYLSPEFCEQCIGVKRSQGDKYRFALMGLVDFIYRAWRDQRGEIVTVTTRQDGICINTDAAAVAVNEGVFRNTTKRIRKLITRVRGIDRLPLSPDERLSQERLAIQTASFYAGGMKQERAALKACKRQTPGALQEKTGAGALHG